MNDLVDRLAVEAADHPAGPRRRRRARATSGPTVGGPDLGRRPARPTGAGGDPAIAGHALVVLGPPRRPSSAATTTTRRPTAVRARLAEILAAKAELRAPTSSWSAGSRLGAEMLGRRGGARASACRSSAVLPYPDPQSVWPAASQAPLRGRWSTGPRRWCCCRSRRPTSKQQAGAALARRDAWLARNAAEAVLVWDGDGRRRSGRLFRSLEDHLGDDVWVLDPTELEP